MQEQISNTIMTILFSPILQFLSTLTPFVIFVQNVKYRLLDESQFCYYGIITVNVADGKSNLLSQLLLVKLHPDNLVGEPAQ